MSRGLARDLLAADFRVGPVAELLGPVAHAALGRGEPLPGDRATAAYGDEPLATLTRLFLLGRPVPRAAAAHALAHTGVAGAEQLDLVRALGPGPDDLVEPLADLTPYAADDDEWWLASGLARAGQALAADHVLGVGGASTTLARWTPRTPVATALDIGTGCGVQAFHLATHAAAVTATDTEPRALRFAAFNAALNRSVDDGPFGGRDLELLQGSLLDPVAGRRFDLVVSNPPYVITPRSAGAPRFTYRDGGFTGDDVVRRLIEGVGDVLAPGGTAQLLGNWEHRRDEGWRERVGSWVQASGLHAWVVQREVQDPAEYAETWARDGGRLPGSPGYDELYAAWLADFADRGVEAVGFGVVTLQRSGSGPGPDRLVRRLEEREGPVAGALGAVVVDVLRAERWLLETDDRGLLAGRFTVAADVTEERFAPPGASDPTVIRLQQGGGLMTSVRADTALAAVVGACDGDLPLGALLGAVAELTDEPAGELTGRVLPAIRRLVADGLLQLE